MAQAVVATITMGPFGTREAHAFEEIFSLRQGASLKYSSTALKHQLHPLPLDRHLVCISLTAGSIATLRSTYVSVGPTEEKLLDIRADPMRDGQVSHAMS